MIPMPLTAVESRSLRAALHAQHRTVRARVRIADAQEYVIWDMSRDLVDGSVTQAAPEGGAHRALSVSIFDPRGRYAMDLDPSTGEAVPPLAFIASAHYGIWLPDLERWVDIPVHRGPVTAASREGHTLTIEAQSMERRMMGRAWKTIVLQKGQAKTSAIREVLREGAGQVNFDLPTTTARMSEHMVIGPWEKSFTPWQAANRIASSLGWIIWADARGVVRARRKPSSTSWTFTAAEVVERPTVTGDSLDAINRVEVRGAIKGKARVTGAKMLPGSHALSETALSRNGARYRLTDYIEDDSITTKTEALEVARTLLRGHTNARMEVQMAVQPNPLLERHDIVEVDGAPRTRFTEGVIPLGAGVMSINSTRKAVKWRRAPKGVRR